MKSKFYFFTLILLSIITVFISCKGKESKGNEGSVSLSQKDSGCTNVTSITPVDIDSSVYVDQGTIQDWVQNNNTDAMYNHAWKLWDAMSKETNQCINNKALPVWETWLSRYEIFIQKEKSKTKKISRHLEKPNQFKKGFKLADSSPADDIRLISGMKYNPTTAEFVYSQKYNDKNYMNSLIKPMYATSITPFPSTSIVIKPMYWAVKSSSYTLVPVWQGSNSSSCTEPTPLTWKTYVAITTNKNDANLGKTITIENYQGIDCAGNKIQMTVTAKVVSIDEFYNVKLTQDEVNNINTAGVDDKEGSNPNTGLYKAIVYDFNSGKVSDITVTEGDYAVLVGMHLTTKEIPNWTWQTYWWDDRKANLEPYVQPAPSFIQSPWNNYVCAIGYSMCNNGEKNCTDMSTDATYCASPYIEYTIGGPKASNCMTCHAYATWPGIKSTTKNKGYVDLANDPAFIGNVKLDFLWSINFGLSSQPNSSSK